MWPIETKIRLDIDNVVVYEISCLLPYDRSSDTYSEMIRIQVGSDLAENDPLYYRD